MSLAVLCRSVAVLCRLLAVLCRAEKSQRGKVTQNKAAMLHGIMLVVCDVFAVLPPGDPPPKQGSSVGVLWAR